MDKSIFANMTQSWFWELLDNTPVCIKVFDTSFKLVYINKGGRQEHGISEADIGKWEWIKTLTKEYQAKIQEKFKAALKGESSQVEYEHEAEGSSREWCLGLLTPVKNDQKEVTYILLYSVDITQYKHILNDSQDNEQQYRALLDAAPLCIKWFDSAGNLISVNKHGRQEHHLEGKTEEEIKKWNYWECIEKRCHTELKEKMKLALAGQPQDILLEHVPGTATGKWCQSNLIPVSDEKGKIIYVLFISRDVSDEKDISEARTKDLDQLEKFKTLTVDRELKMIELKKALQEAQDELASMKEGDRKI